jgi:hypothetical protein
MTNKKTKGAVVKRSIEFNEFTKLVDRVLAVPHSVIKERVEEHRRRSAKNPNRRGPKRKIKPSASRASNGQR